MAKKSKAVVEELEDDEELDLEDLDDEADIDEGVDDEDEGEDEEAPAPRSKKKATAKKRTRSNGAIGSADLAEALGTDGRNLRVMLRDKDVGKNENNRYEWASVDAALEELGFDDIEEAQDALKAARDKRLDELKKRNAKSKKSAAKAKAAVEEDDEDEDDEEEAPPPRRKKKSKK